MKPVGATWITYFNMAIDDKKMTMEQAKQFCKEFTSDQVKEAMEKLEKAKPLI